MRPPIPATHVVSLTPFARARSRARDAALFLFCVALLLAAGAASVRGQFADAFDPNADGPVSVVVVQPDGKIFIGGDFHTVSPNGGGIVVRNRIARLNQDGTLDTAFDPNPSGTAGGRLDTTISSIVLQVDGKILVAGDFTSIGGQARTSIARLDGTTGLADSFNPAPTLIAFGGGVFSMALQADGKILEPVMHFGGR